jgi:hypothetical protein
MRVCVVIAKANGAKDKIADATNNLDLFIWLFLVIFVMNAGFTPGSRQA